MVHDMHAHTLRPESSEAGKASEIVYTGRTVILAARVSFGASAECSIRVETPRLSRIPCVNLNSDEQHKQ